MAFATGAIYHHCLVFVNVLPVAKLVRSVLRLFIATRALMRTSADTEAQQLCDLQAFAIDLVMQTPFCVSRNPEAGRLCGTRLQPAIAHAVKLHSAAVMPV
jgi:hypothetical protein